MKILVVDDARVIRSINRNILQEHGVPEDAFLEAADGEAALALAKTVPVGLFLVDWNMPKLDGLSFTRILRGMEQYRETPIVMITSEAARYNVLEAIEAGVSNYIIKPIKADVLWAKLKEYVVADGVRA